MSAPITEAHKVLPTPAKRSINYDEGAQPIAEVERLKRDYEYDHKCLHEVRERCELWRQRAERAEAELAAERARLDWLMAGINEAMKEGAK